jgi:adenosylhomocysteinase
MEYEIKDISLAELGKTRIEWAERRMPVLRRIRERFGKERPLQGLRMGLCLHVTSETANLVLTLKEGGARVALCASNPLSTQDDVAACLVRDFEVPVFAIKGEDEEAYYRHIVRVLSTEPQILMDDGCDLIGTYHMVAMGRKAHLHRVVREWAFPSEEGKAQRMGTSVLGGLEETTTGVIRLRSMERDGVLLFPAIAVNDALTKHMFDNVYGTGQSTIDGILRATNVLLAGRVFVVCGYGWCGKGIAQRAKGMNARVVVTEVDPLKALEAFMDGFCVMDMKTAAPIGDIFVTATGDVRVIRREHFELMKDGAIVANAGHFNVEVDVEALEQIKRRIREYGEEYVLEDGRRIYVLAEGRLVNLSCAEGHPSEVMDMSFSNQALCAEYLRRKSEELGRRVYPVPLEIDREVARLKLELHGVKVDELTEEQRHYLRSWESGT